jgi:hypothetical protein
MQGVVVVWNMQLLKDEVGLLYCVARERSINK